MDLKTAAIFEKIGLEILNFRVETESGDYQACQFDLGPSKIIARKGKITPKKPGQFATFWKRKNNGPIAPFEANDPVDFFVITVESEGKFGQFVFPKMVLLQKRILSSENKEGKRAFRVYPNWDIPTSKQALASQKWQSNYFYQVNETTDWKKVATLFTLNY